MLQYLSCLNRRRIIASWSWWSSGFQRKHTATEMSRGRPAAVAVLAKQYYWPLLLPGTTGVTPKVQFTGKTRKLRVSPTGDPTGT